MTAAIKNITSPSFSIWAVALSLAPPPKQRTAGKLPLLLQPPTHTPSHLHRTRKRLAPRP
eukprot:5793833-Prymnesium_polylepis.2